jgi:hypothetical protein
LSGLRFVAIDYAAIGTVSIMQANRVQADSKANVVSEAAPLACQSPDRVTRFKAR